MNSLNQSKPLNIFVNDCVKIGWNLAIQKPEVKLQCGDETFSEDRHVHFHGLNNVGSRKIRSYLWPTLYDTSNHSFLQKATVVTA